MLRIEALSNVLPIFMTFLATLMVLIICFVKYSRYDFGEDGGEAKGFLGFFLIVGAAIVSTIFYNCLDTWSWIGIFYPEVYGAHLALEALK